jgi:osmotically inducible protein OsmC
MATRNGSAEWKGDLKQGSGRLTVGEGVWSGDYSFASRFEDGEGTNPEELIAAAHSACFSMALAGALAEGGHEPASIKTEAKAHLRNVDGLPTIAQIDLETEGDVPGIDQDTFAEFAEFAEKARAGCAVSRALAGVGEINVTARLAA